MRSGGAKPLIGSLELSVKDARHGGGAFVRMTSPNNRANPIVFRGIAANRDHSLQAPLEIELPQSELSKLKIAKTSRDEIALLNGEGKPGKYRFNDIQIVRGGLGGRLIVISGTYREPKSRRKFEFVAAVDPAPALPAAAVVIIVIGVLAAAVCIIANLVFGAIDLAAIWACVHSGGVPTVTVKGQPHFTVGPGWTLDVSCTWDISVTCNQKPATGAVVGPSGTGGGTEKK